MNDRFVKSIKIFIRSKMISEFRKRDLDGYKKCVNTLNKLKKNVSCLSDIYTKVYYQHLNVYYPRESEHISNIYEKIYKNGVNMAQTTRNLYHSYHTLSNDLGKLSAKYSRLYLEKMDSMFKFNELEKTRDLIAEEKMRLNILKERGASSAEQRAVKHNIRKFTNRLSPLEGVSHDSSERLDSKVAAYKKDFISSWISHMTRQLNDYKANFGTMAKIGEEFVNQGMNFETATFDQDLHNLKSDMIAYTGMKAE